MLRHERQVQDENAGLFTHRHLDGKGDLATPAAKHAGNGGKAKGLGSTRKAFGNITNSQPTAVAELKGQQSVARRALGDITNATPQHRPLQQVQAKAPVQTEAVAGVKSVVSPFWDCILSLNRQSTSNRPTQRKAGAQADQLNSVLNSLALPNASTQLC